LCTAELQAFPPGHYYTLETGLQRYYEPIWLDVAKCNLDADLPKLRQALIDATEKRLMTDVPLGENDTSTTYQQTTQECYYRVDWTQV
jgi:asparagine synthetase B (glutamine-hydrolysing)